jgi:hypothetical protein
LEEFDLSHINMDNPIGHKGKMAIEFARLIHGLWHETGTTFSPWGFKRAVGSIAP